MTGLILMLVILGGFYKLGHLMGGHRERERHAAAVKEATKNITSMEGWKR